MSLDQSVLEAAASAIEHSVRHEMAQARIRILNTVKLRAIIQRLLPTWDRHPETLIDLIIQVLSEVRSDNTMWEREPE